MELHRHRVSTSVRTEGGLLPADLLGKIAAVDRDVPGLSEADFGLESGDRVREAITRSWNRLVGAWAALGAARVAATNDRDPLTSPTRERWLLPLFEELGFGRLATARAIEIEGTSYPISHAWMERVPIHLVGFGIELDRRTPGVRGAAGAAPHALVQEYLNRSDAALWGIVSNGRLLRLLRDSTSLTRQAFVEFDLEAIFEGELYADFALLWSVCHRTRFEGAKPEDCLLERWSKKAADDGTRALDQLRGGVEKAIETFGAGFLAHPSNGALREALRSGALNRQDYYRELLRLVYRLIFLFTAEDRRDETTGRELLLDPTASDEAAERYRRFYSTARLRAIAGRRRGTRHPDLWVSLRRVIAAIGGEGAPTLAIPALGPFLLGPTACPHLDGADLRNEDLLDAIRALATIEEDRRLRLVDYRNLGAEELGGIYESLLELHPRLEVDATPPHFRLEIAAGNERKATGSYYTPTSLISCLLDSALDPVVDEVVRGKDAEAAERAILALTVIDPAAGSGHFLVAAAHRLAKRLASIRTGEGEPAPSAIRHALREVIARCIYAVDINPMAVELCKVSLWLEALEPGRPLSFLDAHIKCGNSLLGTTADLVAAGIPDAAYEAIAADDKSLLKRNLKRRNRSERDVGQLSLEELDVDYSRALPGAFERLESLPDAGWREIQAKERAYRELTESQPFLSAKLAADTWCVAFLQEAAQEGRGITTGLLRAICRFPPGGASDMADWVESVADRHRLFHWSVEFPHIVVPLVPASRPSNAETPRRCGFDVVLGNPPWLSYSGRQAVSSDPGELSLLKFSLPAVSRWPATHTAFLVAAMSLVRPGGAVGLVLPFQVALLESYGGARDAVRACANHVEVLDLGEDAFEGISQRVGLFTVTTTDPVGSGDWVVRQREPSPDEVVDSDGTANAGPSERIRRLRDLPHFPPGTFSDPGVHTGNVGKLIVSDSFLDDADHPLIREGKDFSAYRCGAPRKRLWIRPSLEEGQYCRIGRLERYVGTPILLRQTADRPIACRHLDRTYFRNSIIACSGIAGVADEVVVAILNSELMATYYKRTVLDSAQAAFPQVKVRSLQGLPMFDSRVLAEDAGALAMTREQQIVGLVRQLESLDSDAPERTALLESVDRAVLVLYGLEDLAI